MTLTTKQTEMIAAIRGAMEEELIKQLNENVGSKLTPALGTGIFNIVSSSAERQVQELQSVENK